MTNAAAQSGLRDPDRLSLQARDYLAAADGPEASTAAEEMLRRAYLRVAADLDALRDAHPDTDAITEQFGSLLHEKIAALILLAHFTLRDLAEPMPCLDTEWARRDMTCYVDLLTRLGAVEGLGVLYDFARTQRQAAKANFWPDVCRFLLAQMAGMTGSDGTVPRFLAERPAARQCLGELAETATPELAERMAALLAQVAQPGAPPPYLRVYAQYDDRLPYDPARGACALVAAQYRIQQGYHAGDLPGLRHWFAEGSPAAVREVFRLAEESLAGKKQARLFIEFLQMPQLDAVRQTAAVLQLGTLNLAERPEGGLAEINRALVECALTHDPAREGVARTAVRELVLVRNQDALLYIMVHAPLLPVAEEGVAALRDLRRLRVVEPLLNVRPDLRPAYRAAHQHLLEIQHIVEAIWSVATPDLAEVYLERLKTLKAYPELDRLTELQQRGNAVFL